MMTYNKATLGSVRGSTSNLKLRTPRRPREGDHIPDIPHTGNEQDESFQSKAEAGVRPVSYTHLTLPTSDLV